MGVLNMNNSQGCNKVKRLHIVLLTIFFVVFIWSLIKPKSYLIWCLEAFPLVIGVIIVIWLFKRFQFTDFLYVLILIQFIMMLIGAHYTYSEEPFFNWIKATWGLNRNYYDRLGHLVQGLFPAFIIREILIREYKFRRGFMLTIIVILSCLGISAAYELIEWVIAIVGGKATEPFLGLQGDDWDTQWDMFCALAGSVITTTMFNKFHDKLIKKVEL